ncbi:1-(5-phosphoribosyl)-5-[(5-phosphoribosylamino)methylideneamino]imidazole-4-carboxamide isomerase [Chloroflexota bacterium]
MEIIPAVDIRRGRCVRLYQGDYTRETVFSDDPLETALKWQSMGAPRLHIVDLDGAAAGEPLNLGIAKEIAEALLIPTELGGGIRTLEVIEEALKAGVEQVILGTAAVEDRELIRAACRRYRESVILGIDAREGHVATRGWLKDTELTALELAEDMISLGVRRIIYTDIMRDGTLTEPNFAAISELKDRLRVPVIAAGGIASVNHLKLLAKIGVEGAIVGRALYTGDINLKKAIAAISEF